MDVQLKIYLIGLEPLKKKNSNTLEAVAGTDARRRQRDFRDS